MIVALSIIVLFIGICIWAYIYDKIDARRERLARKRKINKWLRYERKKPKVRILVVYDTGYGLLKETTNYFEPLVEDCSYFIYKKTSLQFAEEAIRKAAELGIYTKDNIFIPIRSIHSLSIIN